MSSGQTAPAPSLPAPLTSEVPAAAETRDPPAPAAPAAGTTAPAADAEPTTSTPGPAASATSLRSTSLRPTPPDLPRSVPAAPPEQPPELATAESPAVPSSGPAPVEELFARLRDQSPPPPVAPSSTHPPTPHRTAPAADARSDDVVNEDALARRDQQLDPLDADLTRALKRILQDEQNDVLERLREAGKGAATSVLAALEHQTSAFTAAAAPALAAAYQAGGGKGDDTTGFALGGRLANDLATPLRERLERVVEGAGDDVDELSEAVRAAYRHAKLQEIEQLVRHHTAAAHALGAYSSAAEGSLLRWVVDDEGPCPDCHDNALAGPTAKGEPYPTGQDHPPAHLGCRCLLVPAAT